jgi:hypothetical protein
MELQRFHSTGFAVVGDVHHNRTLNLASEGKAA